MTGDDHPIHYDDAYAAKTRFGKRLAHGLLVMSMTALGATPMSRQLEDAMVAFMEQGARFLKPVFVGDTLASRFEVASVKRLEGRNTAVVRFDIRLVNGRDETVLEGHHTYLLLCRPANGQTPERQNVG
jgi:acyl dehydratase